MLGPHGHKYPRQLTGTDWQHVMLLTDIKQGVEPLQWHLGCNCLCLVCYAIGNRINDGLALQEPLAVKLGQC